MTEKHLDKYLQWIDQGESFSKIREGLINTGVDPKDVKSVLNNLDRLVVDRKIRKLNTSQGIQWIIAGSILLILSLILFVFGLFPMIFFASAGVASGMGMILWGKKKMNENLKLKSPGKKEEFKRQT